MEQRTRTEYSTMNTMVSVTARVTAILMGFITRIVFTRTLSESYVGINGLFSNIINILSLTELGVGTAITYALYKPIAEKDIEKQQALMQLFLKFYRFTACCVAGLGLAVIPFLDVLMKGRQGIEHLLLIYLMYLVNSVLSYLLIYKRTLIEAHQMNYIVLLFQTGFLVLQDICQIIILLLTGNFILFLLIAILCTVLNNICISLKADKMFPYLKHKEKKPLPKTEKQEITHNIKAMLVHRISEVVVNNTDNLLISSLDGVISVGIYSNYFLLIGSVRQVLDQIFQGITASVGNLGATENPQRVRYVFETAFFIGQWMYGFAAICLYELLDPFVEISFGAQWVFRKEIVLILCINFFVNGTRKVVLTFRDSLGLFSFDQYVALLQAILNIVVSILLGLLWGTFGIFVGTLFAMVSTTVWVGPYILYKKQLQTRIAPFYLKYLIYVLGVAFVWGLNDWVCRMASGGLVWVLLYRLMCSLLIPNLFLLLFYHRTREFKVVLRKLKEIKNLDFLKRGGREKENGRAD